jgi:hypothetical protein
LSDAVNWKRKEAAVSSSDLCACGAGRRNTGKEERPMTAFTLWVAALIVACFKYYLMHRLMK